MGPLVRRPSQVESGNDVKSAASARGLGVTQTAEAIQVGAVRFGKTASPLVLSVAYRQEDIGKGLNGFTVTDEKGMAHELNSEAVTAEDVKYRADTVVFFLYPKNRNAGGLKAGVLLIIRNANNKKRKQK